MKGFDHDFSLQHFKHSMLSFKMETIEWSIKILGFSGNILCYFLQVFKKSLFAKIVSCVGHLNYYRVIAGLQVVMATAALSAALCSELTSQTSSNNIQDNWPVLSESLI